MHTYAYRCHCLFDHLLYIGVWDRNSLQPCTAACMEGLHAIFQGRACCLRRLQEASQACSTPRSAREHISTHLYMCFSPNNTQCTSSSSC